MGAFKQERDNLQIIMSGLLEHLFGGFTNMMPGENVVSPILEGLGECRVKRLPDERCRHLTHLDILIYNIFLTHTSYLYGKGVLIFP